MAVMESMALMPLLAANTMSERVVFASMMLDVRCFESTLLGVLGRRLTKAERSIVGRRFVGRFDVAVEFPTTLLLAHRLLYTSLSRPFQNLAIVYLAPDNGEQQLVHGKVYIDANTPPPLFFFFFLLAAYSLWEKGLEVLGKVSFSRYLT